MSDGVAVSAGVTVEVGTGEAVSADCGVAVETAGTVGLLVGTSVGGEVGAAVAVGDDET